MDFIVSYIYGEGNQVANNLASKETYYRVLIITSLFWFLRSFINNSIFAWIIFRGWTLSCPIFMGKVTKLLIIWPLRLCILLRIDSGVLLWILLSIYLGEKCHLGFFTVFVTSCAYSFPLKIIPMEYFIERVLSRQA